MSMAIAAGLASLFTFPLAALIALVFRFPVPFVGYESGIDGIKPALYAVYFYGVSLGGFSIVVILGAIAGFAIHKRGHVDSGIYWRRMFGFSACAAGAPLLVLSVLDYLIGPW
jgi:hypothetical protein